MIKKQAVQIRYNKEFVDRVNTRNPGSDTQKKIWQAIAYTPPSLEIWKAAAAFLAHTAWTFEGELHLDDTGDTGFSCVIPAEQLSMVIAGIICQQMTLGAKIPLRAIEMNGPDGRLVLSRRAAANLKTLIPTMRLEGGIQEAGRAFLII